MWNAKRIINIFLSFIRITVPRRRSGRRDLEFVLLLVFLVQ